MRQVPWHFLEKEFSFRDKSLPDLIGVIVFDPQFSNWKPRNYSLASRSYVINSGAKYFNASMCGSSIFGSCIDGTDNYIKLSNYLGSWRSSYCLIFDDLNEYNLWKDKVIDEHNKFHKSYNNQ